MCHPTPTSGELQSMTTSVNEASKQSRPRMKNRRLRILICPDKAVRTTLRAPPKPAKYKKGVLIEWFMDLPQDVALEIVSYVRPVDLLALSRVSKHFRSFFMSQTATIIWKRVLSQVPRLPPCPEDLNHPQYASLLFERACMACLGTRGNITTNYLVRLRLCTKCFQANLATGHTILKTLPEAAKVFPLVPSSGFDPRRMTTVPDVLDSSKNTPGMKYFIPEVRMMLQECVSRQMTCDPSSYESFIIEQKVEATKIMNHGLDIVAWEDYNWQEYEREKSERKARRRESIFTEMKALGWDPKYFPTEDDDELAVDPRWNTFLDMPMNLSAEEWKIIRRPLEDLYNARRCTCLMRDLLQKLGDAYGQYRMSQPTQIRRHLPPFSYFRTDQLLTNFVSLYWDKNCPDEEINKFFKALRVRSQDFLPVAKANLVRILQEATPYRKLKAKVLKQARALFLCSCDPCYDDDEIYDERVHGYPSILDHWLDDHLMQSWTESNSDIDSSRLLVEVAEDVLTALGLPKNCPTDEVEKLGNLICRCGHPRHLEPMDFRRLVQHIFSVKSSYRETLLHVPVMNLTIVTNMIFDSHGPEQLKALVAPASSLKDGEIIAPISSAPIDPTGPVYCRHCYILSRKPCEIYKGWPAEYHMKTLHGKDWDDDDVSILLSDLLRRHGPPLF